MENSPLSALFSLLPIVLMSLPVGITAHVLAKEKGRSVVLWTVLGLLPIINVFCFGFFVGSANLRLEGKVDQLIEQLNSVTSLSCQHGTQST
jgi:hypothetical protein